MSELHRRFADFEWEGVSRQPYKEDGAAPFKAISRQVLFSEASMGCELRYFEVAPGGWSSLERHHHAHAVMIVRGSARVLVGDRVIDAATHDLVRVPPLTWHQFQPAGAEPLGFLCMVDCERDRPERPDSAALAALRADPVIAAFIQA